MKRGFLLLRSTFYILRSRSGFTLVELLVFSAIFAAITVAFIAILVSLTNVQARQFAVAEVNQQSQFVLQTIQRLVEGSSLIELSQDATTSTLKLRTAAAGKDPTYVYLSSGVIYLKETEGGAAEPLTTSRVIVTNLAFTKRTNPSGRDSVSVAFTIQYNTANLKQRFSQALRTSVARVSAATFDSDIRASSTNVYKIGATTAEWQSMNNTIFFSGSNVGIGVSSPQQTLDVGGGLRIGTTGSPPSCTATIRGTLWFTPNAVATDTLQVCIRNAVGTFLWMNVY